MGCGQSVPPTNPDLVGLWISDDATNVPTLRQIYERECLYSRYKVSRRAADGRFGHCTGAAFEVEPDGYVRYVEMNDEGTAWTAYSGPITDWNGPEGVWAGCCAGCCCYGAKGCMHFVAEVGETRADGVALTINGRRFSKQSQWEKE